MKHLEKRDVLGFLVTLAFIIIASFAGRGLGPATVEYYTSIIMTLLMLLGIFFIYKAGTTWAGDFARYLSIMGGGFLLILISWMPHIHWHMVGLQPGVSGIGPTWLSIHPTFWLNFFHLITAMGFGVMTYGFYLFWKEMER